MVGMEKRCAEIRKHLDLFIDPGQITELRAFRGDRTPAASVLYRDLDAMARRAVQLDEESGISGVFFVPNPIKDDVLTPKCPYRKGTANAQLIRERHWLLIDVDAVRVDGEGNRLADQDQPTTDAEREAGWAVLERCRVILEDAGFQGQIVGSSGNCWHLSYPVSLSNDQAAYSSVSSFLAELEDRCGDQWARIDQKPKDAPRLWKIPGTRARKGKESPGRPWRYSWIHQGTRPTPEVRLHNNACLERLLALWRGQRAAYAMPTRTPSSDVVARARLYIEKEDPAIQGNDGSGKCFHVAGILTQGFLLSDSDAMAAIQDWNARCQPPWSEGELLHKFNDARNSPCDKPLGYLLNWEPAKVEAPRMESAGPGEEKKKAKVAIHTLADIMRMDLPEPQWAIPGILSEGLTILAGKPKLGKSFLALNLAITLANGGKALGDIPVTPGDVLYLSLEDRLRRVQDRSRKILWGLGADASERLHVCVECPRMGAGGLEAIEEWVSSVSAPKLVIVDVWAKFRPIAKGGNSSAYDQDYEMVSALKSVGDRHGLSVLILHHCKKAVADDVVDEISGTLGIAGAADGVTVLTRARSENEATLFVSGRDVEENSLALTFDPKTCTWKSEGDAEKRTRSKVRLAVLELFKASSAPMFTSDVATAINMPVPSVKKELWRMEQEGILRKIGSKYSWPGKDDQAGNDEAEF